MAFIRFGGQAGVRVALHEIAHTLGVGTSGRWNNFRDGNSWTGEWVTTYGEIFEATPISAGRQHFWPFGLNYQREASPFNFFAHVKMVEAFPCDLGVVTGCATFDPAVEFAADGDAETPVVLPGDVDCDGGATVVDALLLAQYVVGSRSDRGACPLDDPTRELNAQGGDVDGSGEIDVIDALLIAQCSVGIVSEVCPADPVAD